MNAADAIRSVSRISEPLWVELVKLGLDAIRALAEWLDGDDDHPAPTHVLERLPDVLSSELALARMESRAARTSRR